MKKTLPNQLKHYLIALVFGLSSLHVGFGQSSDLRIDFTGPQPAFVQVGAIFAVSATVSRDVNSSDVPAGETLLQQIQDRAELWWAIRKFGMDFETEIPVY